MNDYFNNETPQLAGGGRARAVQVEAKFQEVRVGFDRLPAQALLKQGRVNYAVTTGSSNFYEASLPYAPAYYTDGLKIAMRLNHTNTGAATLNLNGLGIRALRRLDGSPLAAGDLQAGWVIDARYNEEGDYWITEAGVASAAASALVSEQNAAGSARQAQEWAQNVRPSSVYDQEAAADVWVIKYAPDTGPPLIQCYRRETAHLADPYCGDGAHAGAGTYCGEGDGVLATLRDLAFARLEHWHDGFGRTYRTDIYFDEAVSGRAILNY